MDLGKFVGQLERYVAAWQDPKLEINAVYLGKNGPLGKEEPTGEAAGVRLFIIDEEILANQPGYVVTVDRNQMVNEETYPIILWIRGDGDVTGENVAAVLLMKEEVAQLHASLGTWLKLLEGM